MQPEMRFARVACHRSTKVLGIVDDLEPHWERLNSGHRVAGLRRMPVSAWLMSPPCTWPRVGISVDRRSAAADGRSAGRTGSGSAPGRRAWVSWCPSRSTVELLIRGAPRAVCIEVQEDGARSRAWGGVEI